MTPPATHLLLDLDGTLLASGGIALRLAFIRGSVAYLRRRGVPVWRAIQALNQMRKAIEKPGRDHTNEHRAALAFARALKLEAAEARALASGMLAEVFPTLRKHFSPIPGAREFVEWAAGRYALTLATNPVWPREIVDLRLEWGGLSSSTFGFVANAGEMHACKPCVEYYHELTRRLNLVPAETLMIGDSRHKDLPASLAGFPVFLLKPSSASLSAESLSPGVWSGGFGALKQFIERPTNS